MPIIHLLPRIEAQNTGPAERRPRAKPPAIPTLGHRGRTTIPDEVIAGIRWMSEHGYAQAEIGALLRMDRHQVWAIIAGQTRLHVPSAQPREAFWLWAAGRWV